jgi:hypothetical protein
MGSDIDFSTNRHLATRPAGRGLLLRHPTISFNDGNIAIVTGNYYFLVHKGLLYRHSEVLAAAELSKTTLQICEGVPVLQLDDSPEDMAEFLLALYDGM